MPSYSKTLTALQDAINSLDAAREQVDELFGFLYPDKGSRTGVTYPDVSFPVVTNQLRDAKNALVTARDRLHTGCLPYITRFHSEVI